MITLDKTITSNFNSEIGDLEIQGSYSYKQNEVLSIDAVVNLNNNLVCRFHCYNFDNEMKVNIVDVTFDYLESCIQAITQIYNEVIEIAKG